MDFDNHNNQKKRNYSNNPNYNSDSNFDDFNEKNKENNIIPEILYDNFDDDRVRDPSDDNLNVDKINSSKTENIRNNNSKNDIDKRIDTNNFIEAFNDFSLNESNNNINNNTNTNTNGVNNINKETINKETELINRPVDVRIIVDGPEKSEFLSKAIKNISLFDDFNIIISSIITTNNVDIAKNAVLGSNIILIAINPDEEGEILFSKFYDNLKTDLNYVEFLKFPKLRDIEITDIKNVENEVKNSIIRAGFASIFDISNVNQVKSEILKLNKNLENSQAINEKTSLENDMLIEEAKNLRTINEELNKEIKDLQNHIDEIKLDFTDFKSRYSNMHSKNLLEIFLIKELWVEIFNEALSDEDVDKVVIATNKFRPENVLVGQDYIGTISKSDAVDWLKIVKTALIFVENDNNELQEEMIDYYKKKQKSENNNYEKYSNSYYNDSKRDSDKSYHKDSYKESYSDSSKDSGNYYDGSKSEYDNKEHNHEKSDDKYHNSRNNKYIDEDEDYDYDITNQFRNFWD
ncbi:hypothetical protein KQY27_03080 [Methanobrevibacter sp. TMH8]|uniref:hypothetical protein n=1 Tax=Methanobrevibacter sp. TMH8 TaxID=2848611 RepID=UPI001CCD43BC|nr:hypothetical protein [Methanobrevibacter sp. TMH8]MBZ9570528.1 hypothetical protein [Methanobrevibacter sp. TMH8]